MASKVLTWLSWIIILHNYYAISNSNDLICMWYNKSGKRGTRKENKLPGITLRAAKCWSLYLCVQSDNFDLRRRWSSFPIFFWYCLKTLLCDWLQVRLVDAGFVWTEPHSKRIKVKLTIQKEVSYCSVFIKIKEQLPVTWLKCSLPKKSVNFF